MWLVSPSIPRSVRDFLDQIGIEYTEIHEAEFRKVAACRGYSFVGVDVISQADSSPASAKTLSTVSRTRNEQRNQGAVSWFFNTDEGEPEGVGAYVRMLENSCIALWEYPDTEKKLSKPKPGERVFFYLNGVGIIATGIFTIEPPISSNLIFRKQTQQEFIRRVSDLLSVANDSAITVSEVAQMGYVLPCVSSLCRISNEQVADKMLRELESRNGVRC
jgi:hypothetical protein